MEFQNPWEECSDDYEALSFCDLVTEEGIEEFALRDSTMESLDPESFDFDFDFGFDRCSFKSEHVFPADELFRHGFLLPLKSVEYSSTKKSKSEKPLVRRNDSVDSPSTLWSTSTKTDSGKILVRSDSKSKGNGMPRSSKIHSGEVLRHSKSKGNGKPPASGGKKSGKWGSLTLGMMETPPMKLEDMRLRQSKNRNSVNGAKNLEIRRSISCDYYKDAKFEEAVKFEKKRRSGKENLVVKKTPWLKGWKTLARCPSFGFCRTSRYVAVDNCRLQKVG